MRMSTTLNVKTLLAGALVVAATLGSYGCGPVVPVTPTWEHDIRPLTLARCVRCHDDPTMGGTATFSLNYATFAEIPSGVVTQMMMLVGKVVRGEKPFDGQLPGMRRMPLPPSAALEDWQIEMLDNWAFSPQ
jgi:hypothetical protein